MQSSVFRSLAPILRLMVVWFAMVMPVMNCAWAGERIALVIGNSDYKHIGHLANPSSDAELMARTLSDVGFDVVRLTDAGNLAMRRAIRDFGRRLRAAGGEAVGLFYFAGHGVQSSEVNYLLPSEAALEDEADLMIEAVAANWVLAQMQSAGNGLNIVILDACRNNPFGSSFRSPERGLAEMGAPLGSFIAYATAPGMAAADGTGRNSPFTRALAEAIRIPGRPIEQVFKTVRVSVLHETDGRQTPWDASSLTQDFYFSPRAAGTAPLAPAETSAAPTGAVPTSAAAIEAALDLSAEEVSDIERRLAVLGHGLARPDGRLSALDRKGLAAWQAAQGRPDTGHLTYADLLALRSPPAEAPTLPQPPEAPDATAPTDPAATEAALALDTAARRMIQRRLDWLGHDPRGIDGTFGPGSRGAIAAWQARTGRPDHGYLDADQIAVIESATREREQAWRAEEEARRRAAAALAAKRAEQARARPSVPDPSRGTETSTSNPRTGRYLDQRGCLREASGAVVPGFNSACD